MTFGETHKIITGISSVVVIVGGITTAVTWAILWFDRLERASSANACVVDAKIDILRAELRIVKLQS